MHMEYRVTLPDHHWVIANKHKLIPSVYAAIEVHSDGLGKPSFVGYSGPTYIAVRSGKHSSSTALSHALDFNKLIDLKEFQDFSKNGSFVKPVVILTVDGGPDENPRYQKVIEVAVHHFLEHDLDCLFLAANAPGKSAFNRVERRMSPLSRELSGVILPHDNYGNHLNNAGFTIDNTLEKINFQYAGETLAEIWSNVSIDKFPVVAEFIVPEKSEILYSTLKTKDSFWYARHVQTSQYFLQIVKCENRNCCKQPRGSYFTVIPDRFFPPLIPLSQLPEGRLQVPNFFLLVK
ncbi:uncharacterized protein LOC124807609 [Hydra vulgaris]|uniref:uncharacterized protein LOC124807609 n=1 Tax=Hydra vulgaris TaxID=6087 RepID=UPI001F5EC305|nr:uncharacterized protein LOC124807609 [Hydra vulgaris]